MEVKGIGESEGTFLRIKLRNAGELARVRWHENTNKQVEGVPGTPKRTEKTQSLRKAFL
jgi:hypothetical protein